MLNLLALDENFTFEGDKASLNLSSQIKQKNQKWIFHRKLYITVPTSELWREGKLSNLRTPRGRAVHEENLLKFTETRARAPRARYVLTFW